MKTIPMRFSEKGPGLASLRNLGPKSAAALARVGVKTREDLQRLGGVGAFQLLKEKGIPVSKNMAYAIEGALMEVDWRALPFEFKLDINSRLAASSREEALKQRPHSRMKGIR